MPSVTLYKYRELNERTLDILRTSTMWYATPASLNDTFEFDVPYYIPLPAEDVVRIYESQFDLTRTAQNLLDAMMRHAGGTSFEATEEFLNDFLSKAAPEELAWYGIGLIFFFSQQGLTPAQIAERLSHLIDGVLLPYLKEFLRSIAEQNRAIGEPFGVCSFARTPANRLMWAHYAASHRGICIGITFDEHDLSGLLPLAVNYASELPKVDPMKFFDRSQQSVIEMFTLLYGTKHSDWSYEEEFRLIAPRGGNALHPIPGRITHVFFGEKLDVERFAEVRDAVAQATKPDFFAMMREPGTWNYIASPINF